MNEESTQIQVTEPLGTVLDKCTVPIKLNYPPCKLPPLIKSDLGDFSIWRVKLPPLNKRRRRNFFDKKITFLRISNGILGIFGNIILNYPPLIKRLPKLQGGVV